MFLASKNSGGGGPQGLECLQGLLWELQTYPVLWDSPTPGCLATCALPTASLQGLDPGCVLGRELGGQNTGVSPFCPSFPPLTTKGLSTFRLSLTVMPRASFSARELLHICPLLPVGK